MTGFTGSLGPRMKFEVNEEPITDLAEYAAIPIAFEVGLVLDVANPGNDLREFIQMLWHKDLLRKDS